MVHCVELSLMRSQRSHVAICIPCKTIIASSVLVPRVFGAEYPLRLSLIFWQELTTAYNTVCLR